MPKRFFRKISPSEQSMQDNRLMRLFGKTLLRRQFWHLNRHSTAWGVASGCFWAWIAVPVQTIAAVATAIAGRGNVALAMAFTWVSNPVTWIPCLWLGYKVGIFITGAEGVRGFQDEIENIMTSGLIQGTMIAVRMVIEDAARIWPMYLGGAVIGIVNAAIGYTAVQVGWRWNVSRRWRKRHATRVRLNPAKRLSSGFAHLARKAQLSGKTQLSRTA